MPAEDQCISPNFFVIGAAKSGTTSLYHYLDQHPAVWMCPIKEPCYFSPEVVDFTEDSRRHFAADAAALRLYLEGDLLEKRRSGIVLEWEQYLKLFKNARSATAIGEASVNYLSSSHAPAAIRARIPGARLIMLLRDPVDRLYSQYAGARSTGDTGAAFLTWVAEQQSLESRRHPQYGPVWTGRYAQHLERYLRHFPAHHLRAYLFEDYVRDTGQILRDMLTFLGVDPEWQIDTTQRHNVTLVPRWPRLDSLIRPTLRRVIRATIPSRFVNRVRSSYLAPPHRPSATERARVIEVYREDIRALAKLIQRDLSAWLSA